MSKSVAVEPVEVEPVEVEAAPDKNAEGRRRTKRQPPYNVVLWDDDKHSYAYVIVMLKELFAHPFEKGYAFAKEVDTCGKAIVLTTTLEHAELKRDQIHAYGKDDLIDGCQGSMWATIEPLEG